MIINLLPVRVIVLPVVEVPVTSSSIKLVAAEAKSAFPAVGLAEAGDVCLRALETAPSGATSKVATVSSLKIAVYPFVEFAPCKFRVLGATVIS